MSERNGTSETPIINNFFINHPPEDEDRYAGMHVAWTLDGRKALAAGRSLKELLQTCDELGLIGGEYVSEYMRVD